MTTFSPTECYQKGKSVSVKFSKMNKSFKNVALIVFVIASVIVLLREILEMGIVYKIAKGLLMPSLCVLGLQYIKNEKIRVRYIFAMFFHMMGDIMLLFSSRAAFVCGMGAFFLGHLLFLGIVFRLFTSTPMKLIFIQVLSLGIGFVMAFGIMKLSGIMAYMVVAYTSILVHLVCMTSLFGSKILIAAAILFFVSDFFIAMDVFKAITFAGRSTIVMICYLLSQLFYTQGFARR